MAKRIVRYISGAVILLSALLIALVSVPRLFGLRAYCIASGSMSPAIPVNAVVLVNTKFDPPETGDIITFAMAKNTVTHRVAGMDGTGYITKGDANAAADQAVLQADQIIGKYMFHVPVIGALFINPIPRITWSAVLIAAILSYPKRKEDTP